MIFLLWKNFIARLLRQCWGKTVPSPPPEPRSLGLKPISVTYLPLTGCGNLLKS